MPDPDTICDGTATAPHAPPQCSANIQAQYSYSPFGERTKIAGSGADADFGFGGMYVHARSGLNLTMFRAYDPRLGRWLSRDPLGESMGSNLYAYVGNSPINRIDPLGLDWLGSAVSGVAWGAAGAAGGAATGAAMGLPTAATGPGFVITEPAAIAGGAMLGGAAGFQHGVQQGANWNLGGQIQQGVRDLMHAMSGPEDESAAGGEDSSCPNKRRPSPRGPKRPKGVPYGHGTENYRGGQGWSNEPNRPPQGPPGTSQDMYDPHGWQWFADWLRRYTGL